MSDTLVDKIVEETGASRCVVSALVALSFPLRAALITFLQTYRAKLLAEKAKLVGKTAQADIVAQKLNNVVSAGRAAMAPFNTILDAIPFEQLANNCPDVVEELNSIIGNIPTTIPSNAVTQQLGLAEFDVFAGVTDYKSMRNKLDELAFRLQRATTISNLANKQSTDIDRSLSIIDKYLAIFSKMG
jgi:hypothetical protein